MDAPVPPFGMPHLRGLLTALAEAVAMDRLSAAGSAGQHRLGGRPPAPLPAPAGPSATEGSRQVRITVNVAAPRDRSSSPESEGSAWSAREDGHLHRGLDHAAGDGSRLDARESPVSVPVPPEDPPSCPDGECRPRSPPALDSQLPGERTSPSEAEAGETGPDDHEDEGRTPEEGGADSEVHVEPRNLQASVESTME